MQVPYACVCANEHSLDWCAIIPEIEKDTLVVQTYLLCMFYTNKIILHMYIQLYKWWWQSALIGWLAASWICQHNYIKASA